MNNRIIYPNGDEYPIFTKEDGVFTVTQLQDIVGGYIGIEDIGECCLVYNDEGDLDDKPYNRKATELAREYNNEFRRIISGPAVVCSMGMIRV